MAASPITGKPWHARSSPLARGACAVYALLLLYSGLSPWRGWRDLGVAPLAYLTAWHMLVARAELRPGETVLVNAAGVL